MDLALSIFIYIILGFIVLGIIRPFNRKYDWGLSIDDDEPDYILYQFIVALLWPVLVIIAILYYVVFKPLMTLSNNINRLISMFIGE